MERALKQIETGLLLSADEAGRISLPPGSAMEMDEWVATLLRLQKKSMVYRDPDAPYYSPFYLTEMGRDLHSMLPGNRTPALETAKAMPGA